jgi:hypothetical protein
MAEGDAKVLDVAVRAEPSDPPAAKSIMEPKDWVAVGISTLAFIVSIVSAYFTLFYAVDELSVIFISAPDQSFSEAQSRVFISGDLSILFINGGTRAAAVREVRLEIGAVEHSPYSGDSCKGPRFIAELEPFVIKEKEIVARKLRFRPSFFSALEERTEENGDVSYRFPVDPSQEYSASMCAVFYVSTPTDGLAWKGVNLGTSRLGAFGGGIGMSLSVYTKPFIVHRKVTNPVWRSSTPL